MSWTPHAIHAPFLLDPEVRELDSVFVNSGNGDNYRFAGGCVRSVLMNMKVADVDIATTLLPEEVMAIFRAAGYHVHPTGIDHGTITVVIRGTPFEVTTLRRDVETDGRRAVIEFTKDWAEDAQRRDFRCNALYLDAEGRLYDYVGGGIQDAMERRLVFVGDAETRIREDYLRILRLFRFMATLGATADQSALDACRRWKDGLEQISGERIEKEMMKLLAAPSGTLAAPSGTLAALEAMSQTEVFPLAFGPFFASVDMLRALFSVTDDSVLRLAGVLWGASEEEIEAVFARWKSATAIRQRVLLATGRTRRGHCFAEYRPAYRPQITHTFYEVGAQTARDRMTLGWARNDMGEIPFANVMALADEIEANLPTFPIRGADILALGVKPGRVVGTLLKATEVWWISNGYPDRETTLARLAGVINTQREEST